MVSLTKEVIEKSGRVILGGRSEDSYESLLTMVQPEEVLVGVYDLGTQIIICNFSGRQEFEEMEMKYRRKIVFTRTIYAVKKIN